MISSANATSGVDLPTTTRNLSTVEREKLRSACLDFEAMFIKQMLDSMRSTLSGESILGEGGQAEEIYQDLLYEEYSKVMARTAKLGVAELLERGVATDPRSH